VIRSFLRTLLLLVACARGATVPLAREPDADAAWADWSDRLEHFERLQLQLDVVDCPALGPTERQARFGGPNRARVQLVAHADGRVLVVRPGQPPASWTSPEGLGLDPRTAQAAWRAIRSASSSFTATEVEVQPAYVGTLAVALVPRAPLGAVDRVTVAGRPAYGGRGSGAGEATPPRPAVVRPVVAEPTRIALPGCTVLVTAWWQDVVPPGSAP
jgi:hypothetical protein